MKREDIARIFEGATEAQITEILNLHSADIGSAKAGTAQQITALQAQVTDLQSQIGQRDTDMATLQEQLNAAQTDAGKLAEAQTQLQSLQSKYAADQKKWDEKIAKQAYDFAVREGAGKLKFTSAAAQRDFIREATSKKLAMENGKLLGFDDFTEAYRAENPGALAEEKPAEPEKPEPAPSAPAFVLPATQPGAAANPADGFNFNFSGVRPRPTGNN